MSQYLLRPHVYLCVAPDLAVLLDLRRDEYIGLDQEQAQALGNIVQGWPRSEPSEAKYESSCHADSLAFAEGLVAKGLLTPSLSNGKDATPVRIASPELPLVKKYSDEPLNIGLGDVLRLIAACLTALWLLHARSLEHAVLRVRRRRARIGRVDSTGYLKMRELTTAFLYLKPFLYTTKRKCLFDSLVLIEFLARYGLCPDWVIGVRPQPFAAHSWVQWETYVLNGAPSYVRRYKPILMV